MLGDRFGCAEEEAGGQEVRDALVTAQAAADAAVLALAKERGLSAKAHRAGLSFDAAKIEQCEAKAEEAAGALQRAKKAAGGAQVRGG
jgi:hypothetical protein